VLIDCDSCEVRGLACGDCVVTALLGAPPEGVVLDDEERRALEVLAGSGLVAPLRLVQPEQGSGVRRSDGGAAERLAPGVAATEMSENRRHAGRTRFVS
jgi:hypothetical protein